MSRLLLGLFGWTIVGDVPPVPKAVLVVAPHTSNWDFIIGVLGKFALGLRVRFIGKHTLFRGPLGWWMRRLGGMPVDRSRPGDTVERVVAEFRAADEMLFALAPEGTRRATGGWKTGFYRIAWEAAVPVVPVVIDARRREVRVGDALTLSGEIDRDFTAIAACFADAHGIDEANASPVKPL